MTLFSLIIKPTGKSRAKCEVAPKATALVLSSHKEDKLSALPGAGGRAALFHSSRQPPGWRTGGGVGSLSSPDQLGAEEHMTSSPGGGPFSPSSQGVEPCWVLKSPSPR